MSRTIDFLPFAINTGANVEGQSSYVIEPIRLTGHQAGVAKSAVINKTLRQHSVMVAALANLLSEALDVDLLDDGDVEALKLMLQDVLMGGRSTIMTADHILYVRTTGSDANDGLTPTTAFATPQAAIDHAYDNLQLNGYSLTVDIGPGTFSGIGMAAPLVGQRSSWNLWITGAGMGSTTLASTQQGVSIVDNASCTVSNLRITCVGGSDWGDGCCLMSHNASMNAYDVDFGQCSTTGQAFGNQIHSAMGSYITLGYTDADYSYKISGGGRTFGTAGGGALLQLWNAKVTITGTPHYSGAFVNSFANSTVQSNNVSPGTGTVYSGSATGIRYWVDGVSTINTAGFNGDPTFYPGDAPGLVVNSNVQLNYI